MRARSLFLSLLTLTISISTVMAIPLPVDPWTWPLGGDGYTYVVRKNSRYGTTVENTDYSVRNLDLIHDGDTLSDDHINCFGIGFHRMYHAGVDLYRAYSGDEITLEESTVGAEVKAVFDGTVVHIEDNYPGFVVIVEHTMPSGNQLYSMYAHLDFLNVDLNDSVNIGQSIGTVRFAKHDGRFAEFHPILVDANGDPIPDDDGNIQRDDSHLHFELRTFADGSNLFPNYPGCPGLVPGIGYTYPDLPQVYGYIDPLAYIADTIGNPPLNHANYLPMVRRDISCQEGQNLLQYNGGFEFPVDRPAPWFEITTFFEPPNTYYYHLVQDDPYRAFMGYHFAFLGNQVPVGGWIVDEEMVQGISIPGGVTSLEWIQYLWLEQTGGTPQSYGTEWGDKYIFALQNAETGVGLRSDVVIDHTSVNYPNYVWLELTITIPDASDLAGKVVRPSYSSVTDGDTTASTLRVDQVSLIAHCENEQNHSMGEAVEEVLP